MQERSAGIPRRPRRRQHRAAARSARSEHTIVPNKGGASDGRWQSQITLTLAAMETDETRPIEESPRSTVDLGIPGCDPGIEIGRGGFSIIYRARQPAFERDVAIKLLSPGAVDAEDGKRFERELRATGALSNHPHIVTVYSAGETANRQRYIVMEYMPGGSLAQRLSPTLPMDPAEVVRIGVALADALNSAHAAGILHRDIKPENALVSAFGDVKLADFGIARVTGGHETRNGSISMTVAHSAPELFSDSPPTVASDIYSLGSTLFTLLAGAPPFTRSPDQSMVSLIARIVTEPIPDLRQRGVSPELCTVLETAMAKEPARRYRTAAAFRDALSSLASGPGLPSISRRSPVQRRTAIVAATSSAALALVLVVVGVVVFHRAPAPPVVIGVPVAALRTALLTTNDVPKTFAPAATTSFSLENLAMCGNTFPSNGFQREADNSFGNPSTGPFVNSGVASFAPGTAKPALDTLIREITACTPLPNVLFGLPATTTVALRSGPAIGGADQTVRVDLETKSASFTVDHDQVFLRHADVVAVIQYDGISHGDTALVDQLAADIAPRLGQVSH